MNIDQMIAQLLEDSKASHSFQVGGANGYPTSQVFFFSMLSGDRLYLMRTVAPEPLEPEERGAYRRPEEDEDENRDRDEERYNEHLLDEERDESSHEDEIDAGPVLNIPGYATLGLSYLGVMLDVTETERDMYQNAGGEYFYYSPRDGKYIQTVPAR